MPELIQSQKSYKMRKGATGPSRKGKTKSEHYVLTVPVEIGDMLCGRSFTCELTNDGILYRPAEKVAPYTLPTPEWVNDVQS